MWVREHAAELIRVAEMHGATRIGLCGSAARWPEARTPTVAISISTSGPSTKGTQVQKGILDARSRADQLVDGLRSMCPYDVDVRGIPGWPLDEVFEVTMRRDFIDLRAFL